MVPTVSNVQATDSLVNDVEEVGSGLAAEHMSGASMASVGNTEDPQTYIDQPTIEASTSQATAQQANTVGVQARITHCKTPSQKRIAPCSNARNSSSVGS